MIIPILKKEGFLKARRPSNISKGKFLNSLYKKKVTRLYKKNFKTTDFFGSCDDFIHIKNYRKFKNKKIEIMAHPFIDKYGNLINRRDISFENLYNR